MQFFRPNLNVANSTVNDISKLYPVPDSVKAIIKTSCNDCHSNYTVYPWYVNIQPVGWWLTNHINDGKKHFNFSEFAAYPIYRQYDKLGDVIELIDKDEMPLSSYTFIHRDAILNAGERTLLIDWAKMLKDNMKSTYPADSLIKPKDRKK